ncbi:MAG: hypothetical protein OHK0013_10090 [Sandaracinaceae bacterium]
MRDHPRSAAYTAMSFLLGATLFCLAASRASAQAVAATERVRVEEFTVDGNPPPAEYRDLLANAIRPTLGAVERCYDQRLAANPRLGGDYRLRLWVSARQVIRATPESSVGDTQLEECARAAIRTFTLPPQAPEGGATVRFVVRFTPPPSGTIVAAPTPAEPSVIMTPIAPPPPPTVTNPRVQVRIESIRGALAAPSLEQTFPALGFDACATGATGEIPVAVAINARGQISASAGRGATLRDRNVARCVVQRLEALTAPTSSGRTRLRAVFVFVR